MDEGALRWVSVGGFGLQMIPSAEVALLQRLMAERRRSEERGGPSALTGRAWLLGPPAGLHPGRQLLRPGCTTFEATILDAAWAIVVEGLVPNEAVELYAVIEPSVTRARAAWSRSRDP